MSETDIPLDLQSIRFRGLVEQPTAGVFIMQDERFQYVNATFAGMGGFRPEDLIGKGLKDCVREDFANEVMDRCNRRITGEEQGLRFVIRGLDISGKVVYIEVHGQRIEFRGRPAVVGVGVNVTEHVLRDEQLRQSQARSRELAAQLNNIRKERLSARESEVLRMMVGGESLTVIASKLSISVKTISTYRRRILDKLGVTSNAQLVQYAMQHGLVDWHS